MAELENKIVLEDASQEDYERVNSLTKDKFDFVPHEGNIHDQAFETKPVSYLHDCFNRFCKLNRFLFLYILRDSLHLNDK